MSKREMLKNVVFAVPETKQSPEPAAWQPQYPPALLWGKKEKKKGLNNFASELLRCQECACYCSRIWGNFLAFEGLKLARDPVGHSC